MFKNGCVPSIELPMLYGAKDETEFLYDQNSNRGHTKKALQSIQTHSKYNQIKHGMRTKKLEISKTPETT